MLSTETGYIVTNIKESGVALRLCNDTVDFVRGKSQRALVYSREISGKGVTRLLGRGKRRSRMSGAISFAE